MYKFIFIEPKAISPCWILAAPRTGSNLLCELLNYTRLFNPIFNEYYHSISYKNNLETLCLESHIFPKYNKTFTFFAKNASIDIDDVYKRLILFYPKIKFIILMRRDKVKQAISHYFTKQTHIWEIRWKESLIYYSKLEIPYNYDDILKEYNKATVDFLWKETLFLSEKERFIDLYYEDLLSDIQKNMNNVLGFLEIEKKYDWKEIYRKISETRLMVVDHPKKQEYYERFIREFNNA